MASKIEVIQQTSGSNKGKWFVCKGNQYLRHDATWHPNVAHGEYFWDTEEKANAAAKAAEEKDNESAPPP